MKKYLMGGIAAIAICAAFSSCSKNNELFDQNAAEQAKQQEQVNKMNENYEKAFINTFGKPSSTHTWGFGTTKASTRSGNMTGKEKVAETSTGINANANEWADKADASHGHGGWIVPDPLTADQKAVVAAYFQANDDLDYDDPGWCNFFVQQVYKGGKTKVGDTTEGITAANGTNSDSGVMNLLSVGANNQHINNFNGGDYPNAVSVLDNGQTAGGTSHPDQIMLMVNIDDTSCMGYHETASSTQHNDKAALVGWETIRTWANANGLNGDCLADGWNRSFVGFDLALKEGADALDAATVKYNDGPESYNYALVNGEVVSIDGNSEILINGKPIQYASTNTNMYVAAEKTNMGDGDIQAEYRVNGQYIGKYINVDNIMAKLNDGWTPVKDKNLREWVKIGTSDGYFSDWIVTLTEAQRQSEYQGRIMAEDLNASEKSDFDFNDVVFDWKIEGNVATIQLRAAGGVYPLYVGNQEVHAKFGQSVGADGKYAMINTGAGVTATAPSYTYTFPEGTEASAINIPIYVIKDDKTQAYLDASTGKAASKFNTKTTTRWVKEFEDILDAYPDFKGWVADESIDWTTKKNADYLY